MSQSPGLLRLAVLVILLEPFNLLPLALIQARVESLSFVLITLTQFFLRVTLSILLVGVLGWGIAGVLAATALTLGVYSVFLTGRELSAPIVAAILTIIGFSINDTIVIFDRIREDLKLGVRGTFKELMNHALNRTLSRTIITSGTVFLATLSLYLFGGGVINDFAFTFLVGIITGTYSSIYIASALVLWWHKGQRPTGGASQVVMDSAITASANRPAKAA